MSSSTGSSSNIGTSAGEQTSAKHQLDTLPAELLKLIVVLVKEQDERLHDVVDTFETMGWASRVQGNGLNAFSSTCKRLREAALPFMCEHVRSPHLKHPLFQLGALPPALLGGVRKIDCSAIRRETLALLVAGMSLLPNADGMEISRDTMLALSQTNADMANALAAIPSEIIENTFRRCRSRWRSVTYCDGSESDLEQALELFCDPAKLERLELEQFELFELALRHSTQPARLEHLSRYHHLTSLSIDISSDDLLDTADVPNFVRLPALRSFEIEGWAQAILPLAEQMAPNVVDLRINFGPSRLETQPAAFHLPHLRHLTVEMLWTAADLLHAFAKCDIVSLR
ncbi:hypothetical protein NBRC10513v2_004493 [Rhodotorula toruloides]